MYVKRICFWLMVMLLFGSHIFPSSVTQATSKSKRLDVQCISDQQHVGAGGSMSFHILYHNVTNTQISHEWLKVKVPDNLDVEKVSGAEWDSKSRYLKWKVSNLKAKGAGVIHFNLKVKEHVKAGTSFGIYCETESNDDDHSKSKYESNRVKVVVGKEVHQPFFVGYTDGKFHPASYLTRAETAAIIARIKNLPGSSLKQYYKDVNRNHWANRYITKVTEAGYMKGNNGYFHPDDPISRAELVTLVLRLRGVKAVPLKGFDDSDDHWAGNIVATAQMLKFVDGITDKKFNPNGYTERQSAAKLINIALFRGPLVDGDIKVRQHFPDVPRNYWAFGWIEEASMVAHESIRTGRGVEKLIRYLPNQTESL